MDVHSDTPPPKRGREFRAWVTPPLFQQEGWTAEYAPYNARRYSTAVADEVLWDLAIMVDSFGREGNGMREGVVDVRVDAGYMKGWRNFAFVRMWRYVPERPGAGPDDG